MNFSNYNVTFKRGGQNWVVAIGEIKNDTRKDFKSAIFRIFIYSRRQTLGSGLIRVHDFRARSLKPFEVTIERVDFALVHTIARYEILFEGGY
jgi:hypothetical protein